MSSRADLEEKMLAIEYSGLIGRVFENGSQVTSWEKRNFAERTFYEMDAADFRKGIVLLLEVRRQQILVQM